MKLRRLLFRLCLRLLGNERTRRLWGRRFWIMEDQP